MSKISINTKEIVGLLREISNNSKNLQDLAKTIQQDILISMKSEVASLASKELKSTKKEYINSLELSDNKLTLKGELPNAIENGASGFDMKNGFSKSSNVRKSKNGWYLTIPFRVYTPNNGTNSMSWQVYNSIRRNMPYSTGDITTRLPFSDLSTQRTFEAYNRTSPLLSGLNRNKISENRSTYNTFRRVSNNSSPDSWIHPGFIKKDFFERAWRNLDIESIINSRMNGAI